MAVRGVGGAAGLNLAPTCYHVLDVPVTFTVSAAVSLAQVCLSLSLSACCCGPYCCCHCHSKPFVSVKRGDWAFEESKVCRVRALLEDPHFMMTLFRGLDLPGVRNT